MKLIRRRNSILIGLVCLLILGIYIVSNSSFSSKSTRTSGRVILEDMTVSQRLGELLSFVPGVTKRGKDGNDYKTILLWTPFFGQKDYLSSMEAVGCPYERCTFTSNRSLLAESDAILFHLRDLQVSDLPKSRNLDQRWVLLNHESPENSPHHVMGQLLGLINWTITYREDSDIGLSPRVHKLDNPRVTTHAQINWNRNKFRMAAWLVSNCKTPGNREEFVKELQRTVPVDVYGQCGDKQCLPKMSRECLMKLAKEYRFYLSFENSICKDYITEKFFDILETDMVPVTFGGADYDRWAPPHSYINALNFSTPRELGKYLLAVAKNDTAYNAFFRWRDFYEMKIEHYACILCRKLHDRSEPRSIYSNLQKWWFEEGNCRTWTPKLSN